MKILYVTRHFNHSGYTILKRLIEEKIPIEAVLLKEECSFFKIPYLRFIAIFSYWIKIKFYRGQFLKTIDSEELLARKNGLKIIKTKSIKSDSFYQDLIELNPDLIILGGGWPELIPSRVFNLPKYGCVNTHPSLLPEFRGTSITRWQILNGVINSGSTIHFVDNKFDTGGAIAQEKLKVSPNWTPQELFNKLGELGAELIISLLRKNSMEFNPKPFYPEHNLSYYNYYSKWIWDIEMLKVDWNKSIRDIHFFILSNSQESYQYLGPISRINGDLYFIRQTKLFLKQEIIPKNLQANNSKSNHIYIYVSSKDNRLFLYRINENYVLEIHKIQKVKFYKIRRAFQPLSKLKFNNNEIFNTLINEK